MYNLQVLNDKDFEDLCKDLLEKDLNIKFQNFKKGSDKGIDLRHSANNGNKIIVQAKHLIGSKYSDLKHQLLKIEKQKIEKLNPPPERYILVTSLALSPQQVDEIEEGLNPYIKSSDDIYGYDRIISMLGNYKDIIEKHYKLWMSSTAVLERILNNSIKGRSEFYQEKILKRLSLYVPTRNFQLAVSKLNENKFIIVTGAPGIGKTTISYLLICDLLSKNYQLIYINDKIQDAEQVLSSDPKKRQVFYFDDFLGSNIYDILNAKNSESSIVGFIERIQSSKNKFLILTTRTTILNQAQHNFEKFRHSKLGILSKYEIELTAYSKLDKAKILYNHLYHTKMELQFFDEIKNNKTYLKIINHANYSPRLIEFITNVKNFQLSSEKQFLDFVFLNLQNPQEIWRSAYENQLEDEDRFLLTTIFSLGGYSIDNENLEKAFKARLNYEIINNGHKLKNDSFNNSIKKLLDGFITSLRFSDKIFFGLLNPSVGDFLLNYIKQSKIEKWRIIRSVIYIDQLTQYFHPDQLEYIPFSSDELDEFYIFFEERATYLKFVSKDQTKASKAIEILKFYLSYFEGRVAELSLVQWTKVIIPSQINRSQFDATINVIAKLSKIPETKQYIVSEWEDFIHVLYSLARYTDDYVAIGGLFEKYGQDFKIFVSKTENHEHLADCIANIFVDSISDDPNLSERTITSASDYYNSGDHKNALAVISDALYEDYSGFIDDLGLSDYHDKLIDRLEIDEDGILDRVIRDRFSEHDNYEGGIGGGESNLLNESDQIDNLFE